jgi:hypothetical protein
MRRITKYVEVLISFGCASQKILGLIPDVHSLQVSFLEQEAPSPKNVSLMTLLLLQMNG